METTHKIGTLPDGGSVYVQIGLKTTDKGIELSISGSAPNTGGQINETVAQVQDFAPGWDAPTRDRLLATWQAYHLNGMQPNCAHQVGEGWTPQPVVIHEYSIDWDVRRRFEREQDAYCQANGFRYYSHTPRADIKRKVLQQTAKDSTPARLLLFLDELGIKPFAWITLDPEYVKRKINRIGLMVNERPAIDKTLQHRTETKQTSWLREKDHPDGYLCKPCPTCGYKYGTKWLFLAIPDDELTWLRALQAGDTATDEESQDIEASAFLETHGITFTAEHAQAKASQWGADKDQHWRVTLAQDPAAEMIGPRRRLNGENRTQLEPLTFDFWNSQHDTEAGIDLDAAAVLSSLASDIGHTDPDELAQELELSPTQAYAAVAFGEELRGFFTEAQQEELARLS